MSFPAGLETVVVDLGTYTSQSGSNAYSGSITFTPTSPRYHLTTGTPLPEDPIDVDLAGGSATVTLVASDASNCTVSDVAYDVVFNVVGPGGRRLSIPPKRIYLQKAIPVQDLDAMSATPGVTPVGVSVPVVSAVAGLSGVVSAGDLVTALTPFLPSGGGGTGGSGKPTAGWAFGDMDANVQTLLGLAHDSVQLGGDLTNTPQAPTIRNGVVTLAKLATSLGLPRTQLASDVQATLGLADTAVQPGGVVTSVNGAHGDVTVSSSGTVGDATTSVKGVVQLSATDGGIGGTAAALAVNGWGNVVKTDDARLADARTPLAHDHDASDITTGAMDAARLGSGAATGRVLTATGPNAASWQVPSGGGGTALSTLALTGPGPHTYADAAWQGKVVEVDSPTPATVKLPVGQSQGGFAHIVAVGAGQVSVVADTGASLAVPVGAVAATRAKNSQITVRRRDDPSGATFPTAGLLARFQGSSLGAAGSSIASWADSSGVGSQALVQPTSGLQPVVATIGAYKSAHFNGLTTGGSFFQLTGALLDLARNRSALVMYAVCVYATNGTPVAGKRTLVSLSVNGATAGRAFLQKETDGTLVAGGRRFDTDTASQSARGGSMPVAQPFLIVGRLQWAANTATVYLNGAVPTTTGFSNPNASWLTGSTANTSNTSSTSGTIGANAAGTAEQWFGDILDLGFFSSDVDRAALGSALQNQYGGIFSTSDYVGAADRWMLSGDLG